MIFKTRIPSLVEGSMPTAWYFLFVPLGFVAIRNARQAMIVAIPALLLAFYAPHVFFLPHYPVIVLPGMALLAVLGMNQSVKFLQGRLPSMRTFLPLSMLVTGITACTPFTILGGYEYSAVDFPVTNYAQERLPTLVKKPALVFCRITSPNYNPHDEPVYNHETAWPDDGRVVLAQYLGPHNIDLIRYYQSIGQNRHVYEFDRNNLQLRSLGTVNDIVKAEPGQAAEPTTRPTTSPQE
ncbi:MAG: hypothetical protein QM754_04490 [Tepidisphaeraceae bacterium]